MMKRLLAAALAVLLGGQEAAAIVVTRAPAVTGRGGVTAVPRVNGLPGGVLGLASPSAGLVSLAGGPAVLAAPALSPEASFVAPAALPEGDRPLSRPEKGPVPFAAADVVDAKSQLAASAAALEGAATPSAKASVLERLFTGARELLGLGEGAVAVASVAPEAPPEGDRPLLRPGKGPVPFIAAFKGRATPPAPVFPESRGLNPGERLLSAPADAPRPEAPKPAPGGDDYVDWHAVKWMFVQRMISITAFILTSIAYPMVVIPAVGPATFGVLMALGPMAAIALGPLSGLIANKLAPREGLATLALLRGGLAAVLPVLAMTGNVTFWPLLLASIANGWQFSLLMTSENSYFRRFAGKNQIGRIMTLGFSSYFVLQVLLGSILGAGGWIDAWAPMTPFWLSAAVHLGLAGLIAWKIPRLPVLAQARKAAEEAAKTLAERARAVASKAGAFLRKFWKEAALFAASLGLYACGLPLALPVIGAIAPGSPLWMAGALLYWISRGAPFKKVWADAPVRNAILLSALSAGLFYPFQNLALPLVATALGSKALIYGQLLGAFFFGQLIANVAMAKGLPTVAGKPLETWLRAAVLGLGAAWSLLSIFPGSLPAAAAAVAAGAGLIFAVKRLTDRGWIRFLGVGLAGSAGVALSWGFYPGIFASVMLMGLFLGPFVSAINGYISRNSKPEDVGVNFGVSSSLFNSSTSFGYGLMTANNKLHENAYPGALWPVVAVYLAAGALFFLAPRWLPGLPGKSVAGAAQPAEKK